MSNRNEASPFGLPYGKYSSLAAVSAFGGLESHIPNREFGQKLTSIKRAVLNPDLRNNAFVSDLINASAYLAEYISSLHGHDSVSHPSLSMSAYPMLDGDIATITKKIGRTLSSFSNEALTLYPDDSEIASLSREVGLISPEPDKLHRAVDLLNRFSQAVLRIHNDKQDGEREYLSTIINHYDGLASSCRELRKFNQNNESVVHAFDAQIGLSLNSLVSVGFESNNIETSKEKISSEVQTIKSSISDFIRNQDEVISKQAEMLDRQSVDVAKMKNDLADLKRKLDEAHQASTVDQLTEVGNRRGYEYQYDIAYKNWVENRTDLGLILVDCDHFKKVNDTYGHAVGDDVLRYIANVLKNIKSLFPSAQISRIGGEEFVVLTPGVSPAKCAGAARVIRSAIEKNPYSSGDGSISINLTVSIGVSFFFDPSDTKEFIFNAADKCLYESKANGRNRAYIHRRNLIEKML